MTKTEGKRERERALSTFFVASYINVHWSRGKSEKDRKTEREKVIQMQKERRSWKDRENIPTFHYQIQHDAENRKREAEGKRDDKIEREREKKRKYRKKETQVRKTEREYFHIACSHLVQIYNHALERKGDRKMKRKR
jgi:hypothetical protein